MSDDTPRMSRRAALSKLGLGGAAVAGAALMPSTAVAVVALTKPKPEPLPEVRAGDVMTADTWNDLVAAVNEVRQR